MRTLCMHNSIYMSSSYIYMHKHLYWNRTLNSNQAFMHNVLQQHCINVHITTFKPVKSFVVFKCIV